MTEEITRFKEDDLQRQVEIKYWRKLENRLQYTLIAFIFISLAVLSHVPKHIAATGVLFYAAFMLILLGISSIVSIKTHKLVMKDLQISLDEIKRLTKRL